MDVPPAAKKPRMEEKSLLKYEKFEIYKDKSLGMGSFAKVYRGKCDQLPCAAKVLFHILDSQQPSEKKKYQQFLQECEIMRTIRHPHIVQCLGVEKDPESGNLVLLMELMDKDLNFFLGDFKESLPYSLEVDLSHDICMALAYLHLNGIIHRDLSCNNVLVTGGRRAKITDFGMSKIYSDCNITTLTSCPGISHYMPPEAIKHPPVYSYNLDCFSIGVLIIQICTRKWPEPGPSHIARPDAESATGTVDVPMLETKRRQNHLSLIGDDNPLRRIAVDCLEYEPDKRPTAPELCNKMEKLKKEVRYSQSVNSSQVSASNSAQNCSDNSLQKDDSKSYQETIESMKSDLQDKECHIELMEDEIKSLEKQYHGSQATIKSLRSDLQEKLNQLELQNERLKQRIQLIQIEQFGTLQWREESTSNITNVPSTTYHNVYQGTAVLDGSHIYFIAKDASYVYDIETKEWNVGFICPTYDCGVGLVYGHLTIFGGRYSQTLTSKDIHWYCDQEWMKLPDSLPHEITDNHAVALTSKYIITIADSIYIHAKYATHNDFRTESWRRVDLEICPNVEDIIICKNMMYMRDKSSVTKWWKCLIKHFDDDYFERWRSVCASPLKNSAYVAVGERILSVGGKDRDGGISRDVYLYDPCFDLWSKISEIEKPRMHSLVALLPATNEIMVMGGEYEYLECQYDYDCEVATIIT